MKGKKGDMSARKIIYYAIFSFVAAATFFIVVYLNSSSNSQKADIPAQLEDYLVSRRFLNSCLAVSDADTGRVYPWIIDISKFTSQNLDGCYFGEKTSQYRLTLAPESGQRLSINTLGWDGFVRKAETKYVFVSSEGAISRANLLVEVSYAR